MLQFPLAPDRAARLLAAALLRVAGGAGSGNFGHSGRPGEVGGSSAGGDGSSFVRNSDAIDMMAPLNDKRMNKPDSYAGGYVHLYHVTDVESAQSINREGFKADAPNQFQGFKSEHDVYGWANLERARLEVQRMDENNPGSAKEFAIVEFQVPQDEWSRLRADEDQGVGTNWQESYKSGLSAAVVGDVPAKWIIGNYIDRNAPVMRGAEFREDQPRDDQGQWSSDGGSSSGGIGPGLSITRNYDTKSLAGGSRRFMIHPESEVAMFGKLDHNWDGTHAEDFYDAQKSNSLLRGGYDEYERGWINVDENELILFDRDPYGDITEAEAFDRRLLVIQQLIARGVVNAKTALTPDFDEGTSSDPLGLAYPSLFEKKSRALEFREDQPRDERGQWSSDGGSASRQEWSKQETLAAQQTNPLAHPDLVIGLNRHGHETERYVAAYGQEFKSSTLPSGVPRGEPKECYRNASLLVMERTDLTYAEGFATSDRTGDLAFMHAWAVDQQGNVVDPTWDRPENGTYFGVKYDRAAYLKYLYTAKIYGVMGSTHNNARKAIDTGVPKLRGLEFNPDQPRDERGQWASAFGTSDRYVYHTTPKTNDLASFAKQGILPSQRGYSGPGVYMANTPEKTLGYTVDELSEAHLFRVDKEKLIASYGAYPKKNDGVEYDDGTGEVILTGDRPVPPEFIEVQINGKWESLRTLGGPGSGNFGHAGRPGEVGGSASEPTRMSSEDGYAWHETGPVAEWAKNLTDDQRKVIATYTGFGYVEQNAYRRGTYEPPIITKTVREATDEEVEALKSMTEPRELPNGDRFSWYPYDKTWRVERKEPDVERIPRIAAEADALDALVRDHGYVLPEDIVVSRYAYYSGLTQEQLLDSIGTEREEKGFTSTMLGDAEGRLQSGPGGAKAEALHRKYGKVDAEEVGTAVMFEITLPKETRVLGVEGARRIYGEGGRTNYLGPEHKNYRSESEVLLGSDAKFHITGMVGGGVSNFAGTKTKFETVKMRYVGGGSSERKP